MPPDALLPDMNAALGLTQVKELERFIARRAELATVFSRAVARGRHAIPAQPGDAENVYYSFPVVLEGSAAEVMQYARKKSVETAFSHEGSILAELAAAARPDTQAAEESSRPAVLEEADFPVARSFLMRSVRFPLYPALSGREASDIERVLGTLP
jgi:dTDP-4-amino-4,6-dideoxygalactose transaminase